MRSLRPKISGVLIGTSLVLHSGAAADPVDAEPAVRAIGIPSGAEENAQAETAETIDSRQVETIESLARQGEWQRAKKEITTLSDNQSDVQLPAGLVERVNAGVTAQQVETAISQRNWDRALELLGPVPQEKCDDGRLLWARRDALRGINDVSRLQSFYENALSQCDASLLPDLLASASGDVDADGLKVLLELPEVRRAEGQESMAGAVQRIQAIVDANDFRRDLDAGLLETAAQSARQSGRADFLRRVAWAYLETDPDIAASLFLDANAKEVTAEGRYGLALARYKAGEPAVALEIANIPFDWGLYEQDVSHLKGLALLSLADQARKDGTYSDAQSYLAEALSSAPDLANEIAELTGTILVMQAGDAMDASDYAHALVLAQQATLYPNTHPAATEQIAWALYNSDRVSEAYDYFEALYRETGEERHARGWMLSAERADRLDAIAIAGAGDGLIARLLSERRAEIAFAEGDYLLASYLGPQQFPELAGMRALSFHQSAGARWQSAGTSESDFNLQTYRTFVRKPVGAHALDFGVLVHESDFDNAGSTPVHRGDLIWSPFLSLSRAGAPGMTIQVATTPIIDGLDTELLGKIGYSRNFDTAFVDVNLFRFGRDDNEDTLFGSRDSNGGSTSPLLETGFDLTARTTIKPNNILGMRLGRSVVDGDQAASNGRTEARLSLSRDLNLEAFDYFQTGPFLQYDAYQENMGSNPPGSVSYFSPQVFVQSGWELNFQSQSLRRILYRGSVSVAHQYIEEEVATNQAISDSAISQSIAANVDLSLGYRVTDTWIVGGYLKGLTSGPFDDVRAGIALTFVPGGRSGLVRNDLQPGAFMEDFWRR